MVGSIIGGALKIGSSIFGGISASKAAKKARERVEQQKRENEDWFNRRYNEDATQRADAQRLLTRTAEAIKERNKAAAGRSAVMGGDDASVAMEKERNAQALADATSNIVAMGEARKDNVEAQYLSRKDNLDNQLVNIENQKAQAIASAVGGAANAAGDIAGGLSDLDEEETKK
jgi:hypothetical protein